MSCAWLNKEDYTHTHTWDSYILEKGLYLAFLQSYSEIKVVFEVSGNVALDFILTLEVFFESGIYFV